MATAGRVFVGNLPLWYGESELLAALPADLGAHDACVVRDRRDGLSRGFGLVTVDDAGLAVRHCQDLSVPDTRQRRAHGASSECIPAAAIGSRRLTVRLAVPDPKTAVASQTRRPTTPPDTKSDASAIPLGVLFILSPPDVVFGDRVN